MAIEGNANGLLSHIDIVLYPMDKMDSKTRHKQNQLDLRSFQSVDLLLLLVPTIFGSPLLSLLLPAFD